MSPHTWVVSPSGLDANFSNLRDAFGNASSGDTLLVLPGTYGYEFNCGLSFGGRNLTVRWSGSGATMVDCEHRGWAFEMVGGEGAATVIEDLTIANGTGVDKESIYSGAIQMAGGASPTVNRVAFTGNAATNSAGAVSIYPGAPKFTDCIFAGNHGQHGGGLYVSAKSTPTFSRCQFLRNAASQGGAAYVESMATFDDCVFSHNNAQSYGGAAALYKSANTSFNTSNTGGKEPPPPGTTQHPPLHTHDQPPCRA